MASSAGHIVTWKGRTSTKLMKSLKEFWLEVAREEWAVQDFSVWPDAKADRAHCFCIFHGHIIHAHVPGLRMKGQFAIYFRHIYHQYEATFKGSYNYVGRGAHRDACLGTLELASIQHLGLFVANDGILPEKIHICMKFSTPCDIEQEYDAKNLKTWSGFENICTQFPRFMHYAKTKAVAGVVRSVLLVEAMGDGSSVGAEIKRIYDCPQRSQTREMFVICMRFMMWAFQLQRGHVVAQGAFLQDMHMNNCVFMHGPIAGQNPQKFVGRGGKYSKFRCIDANGWWNIGCNSWQQLKPLFGCIFDVITTEYWHSCRLHPVHMTAVENVTGKLLCSCIFFGSCKIDKTSGKICLLCFSSRH